MKTLALLAIWLALPLLGHSETLAEMSRRVRAEKAAKKPVPTEKILTNREVGEPVDTKNQTPWADTVVVTKTVNPNRSETDAAPQPEASKQVVSKPALDSGFGRVKTIGTYQTKK